MGQRMRLLGLGHRPAEPAVRGSGPLGLAESQLSGLVNPPSRKERAQAIVTAFAARSRAGRFVHIARADVARGLLERVVRPDGISQSRTSLCGPAALLFNLATRDPVGYVQFVIDLYEKGTARAGGLKVTPGKDLLEYDPKTRLDAVDWIPLASLRDSDNWFFDYQSADNDFSAMTLPNNLVGWFRKIGFKQIVNETNLVITKDEKSIREAARLYRDEFWVCLFVNEQLLDPAKQEKLSLTASHWIVLTSDVTILNGNLSMTVFSWGDGHRAVPYDPTQTLSVTNFLRNYYGYVAARY